MFLKLKNHGFFPPKSPTTVLSSLLLEKMVFRKKSIILESQVLAFERIFATVLEILSLQIQDPEGAIL